MRAPVVNHFVDFTERAVREGRRVWIEGAVGTGRHTVARELRSRMPQTRILELLDADQADAVPGALLPVVATVGDPADRKRAIDDLASVAEAAATAVDSLNEAQAQLVVLVPASWGRSSPFDDEDLQAHLGRRRLLTALSRCRRLVWLADSGVQPEMLGIGVDERMQLAPHRVSFDPSSARWGSYSSAASALGGARLPESALPLVWRLAVGAVALGVDVRDVAAEAPRPPARSLPGLLALLLGRVRSRRDLADAVLRVAQMRRPLPRSAVLALTEVPPEHAALVTECVGYGDPVRPIAILRSRVRAAWPVSRERLDATHAAMAEQYGKLDGAVAAAAISTAEKMEAWVERAHHLAHAGPLGADSWSRLVLPAPELYWDRARHLSREREDYQGAAQVYRACVERFPNDDYAHHCLAWNLEKAGAPPEEPRLHFERAVHLASTNPWWNARHVTFLIGAGL